MQKILFRKGILITKYSKKKICTMLDLRIQWFEELKVYKKKTLPFD
jgi:hypothetical protein